ncbi:MAG: hypothetical protein QY323_02275 [Patescibacteria group bacterium]|nr:MAG: hypothetical protein QY323_02275 [Patescibacteria group bacterium]
MRVLSFAFLLVLIGCGGAQRASSRDAARIAGVQADLGLGGIWRFSFDVSKDWIVPPKPGSKSLTLLDKERSATLTVVIDTSSQSSPASDVAWQCVERVMGDMDEDLGPPDAKTRPSERDAFVAGLGANLAFQCRVHRAISGGRSVWAVFIGVSPHAHQARIAAELDAAAATLKLEPVK